MEKIVTDVLIVGGGGAGLRAAIAAVENGADVVMALRGVPGRSGATAYKCCEIAGYNAPGSGESEDSPEAYYKDMMDAAMGMADPALVQIVAENAMPRFQQLREWGVAPAMDEEGREIVMKGCYSSRRRGYTIKGHGEPIVKAMTERLFSIGGVRMMSGATIIDLLMRAGECCGALAVDGEGELVTISCGAVILCTGGASRVFPQNLNPADVGGAGYSLAYDRGADMMNMEFMQAGVGFFHPLKSLFNTYLWAGFPELRNARGEKFLFKYLPEGVGEREVMLQHCRHFPFSSRDISKHVEIAIQKEINAGGGTGRLCLPVSFSHFTDAYIQSLEYDADLRKLWPLVSEFFAGRGVDLLRQPVEIACVAQAINGGLKIDKNAMSSVPGLFAAGETAAGPHGADRLGGNMMVACQVFGEIAGRNAACFARTKGKHPADVGDLSDCWPVIDLIHRSADVESMCRYLRRAAGEYLFICRTEERLSIMLDIVGSLEKELETAPITDGLHLQNFELYTLMNSARLMAQAALARHESRGSHYREDAPEVRPDLEKPLILNKFEERPRWL